MLCQVIDSFLSTIVQWETDVVTLNLFCGLGLGLWIGLGYQCLFKAKKRKPDGC